MPGSPNVIAARSYAQSLSHSGDHWRISYEATIAAGASHYLGFTSPVNVMVLLSSYRTGADKMRAYLFENLTYSGGTTRAAFAKNRQQIKAAQSVWTIGVTATPPAPQTGGVLFGLKGGGPASFEENYILKKSTPYVLQIINDANSQSDVAFALFDFTEYDLT